MFYGNINNYVHLFDRRRLDEMERQLRERHEKDLDPLRRQQGLQAAFVADLNRRWDHFRSEGRVRLLRAKRQVGTEAFEIAKRIEEGDERCVLTLISEHYILIF